MIGVRRAHRRRSCVWSRWQHASLEWIPEADTIPAAAALVTAHRRPPPGRAASHSAGLTGFVMSPGLA